MLSKVLYTKNIPLSIDNIKIKKLKQINILR